MIIYKWTNLINGKIYIGQSILIARERIEGYKSHVNQVIKGNPKYCNAKYPIMHALAKYGFDNFHFEIIEDGITDLETLNEKEIYYIKLYNARDSEVGYNICEGGKNGRRREWTQEEKQRARERQIERGVWRGDNNPYANRIIKKSEYPNIAKMAEKGLTSKEIGKMYSASAYRISEILRSLGIRRKGLYIKLSMEIANSIREEKNQGATIKELAEKYNVSGQTIRNIVNNKKWKV